MKNQIISASKAAYYAVTEPVQLAIQRFRHELEYTDRPGYNCKNLLISIYCPTYNRSRLLFNRAISSVLSQTYQNWEMIIVGDCCTDDTPVIVDLVDDKRVKFINLPSRKKRYPETPDNHWFCGPVVAANHGLNMCRGKWIARIDDDDIWTPNHLDILLTMAQMLDAEFISSAYGTPDGTVYAEGNDVGGHSSWLYRSYLRHMKYNIDCWRKSNNRVNDLDLADRFRKAGVRIRYFPFETYTILPRPGETEIGSKAYRNSDVIMDKYKFE
jgi:glycosyltransferase involved in cell wall biosynthesis